MLTVVEAQNLQSRCNKQYTIYELLTSTKLNTTLLCKSGYTRRLLPAMHTGYCIAALAIVYMPTRVCIAT